MSEPWRPLGAALRAFHEGDLEARLTVESDLFATERTPAVAYYRPDGDPLPVVEVQALARCRGRILDVGAGAGRHALDLQRSGADVVAIDISEDAVDVMRDRGVRNVHRADLWTFDGAPFDSILMLMNGIGIVGNLDGLGRWLCRMEQLVAPGGCVLCDSAELQGAFVPAELGRGRGRLPRRAGRGEVRFRLSFREYRGDWYRWLFCRRLDLEREAASRGWRVEVVRRGDRGSYLACLSRANE